MKPYNINRVDMSSNREIINAIASRREVERIVNSTCGRPIADLAQMIYEILMRMPNERLSKLAQDKQLAYYVMGVARKQYYSNKSKYHNEHRRMPDKTRLANAL